jgi:hypothetical protein
MALSAYLVGNKTVLCREYMLSLMAKVGDIGGGSAALFRVIEPPGFVYDTDRYSEPLCSSLPRE